MMAAATESGMAVRDFVAGCSAGYSYILGFCSIRRASCRLKADDPRQPECTREEAVPVDVVWYPAHRVSHATTVVATSRQSNVFNFSCVLVRVMGSARSPKMKFPTHPAEAQTCCEGQLLSAHEAMAQRPLMWQAVGLMQNALKNIIYNSSLGSDAIFQNLMCSLQATWCMCMMCLVPGV